QRRARLTDMPWGAWSTIEATTATSASDTDFARNTVYQYRVIASNPAGESRPGAESVVVTPELPATPPSAPEAALQFESDKLRLTWAAPSSDTLSYEVHYETQSVFAPAEFTYATTATSLTLPLQRYGTTVAIRVRARNSHGWSPWSETLDLYNNQQPPRDPPAVTATSVGINIAWYVQIILDRYHLQRQESPNGQNWSEAHTYTVATGWTLDRNDQPGAYYRYRLAPSDSAGNPGPYGAWSAPARMLTE